MSLPKLPKLVEKKKRDKKKLRLALVFFIVFAMLIPSLIPQSENLLSIIHLHERVVALEEKVNALSALEPSLITLNSAVSAIRTLLENSISQLTILNNWVASWETTWSGFQGVFSSWRSTVEGWISSFESAWDSFLASLGDWRARIEAWINDWESAWNEFNDWLGEQLENIEAFITAVETYVYEVAELVRQLHGAVVPVHYPNLQSAINAGEKRVVLVGVNDTLNSSTTCLEVSLLRSNLTLVTAGDIKCEMDDYSRLVMNGATFSSLRVSGGRVDFNGSPISCTIFEVYRSRLFFNPSVTVKIKLSDYARLVVEKCEIYGNPDSYRIYIGDTFFITYHSMIVFRENMVYARVFFIVGKNRTMELFGNLFYKLVCMNIEGEGANDRGNIRIENNHFDELQLFCSTPSGFRYVNIVGNRLACLSTGGMHFSVISGNVIDLTFSSATVGISIASGDRLVITNNLVQAWGKTAIQANANASVIVGNNWGGGAVNITGTGNVIANNAG